MFNGIIFNQGLITKFEKRSKGINIFVKADLKLSRKDLGVSVACDGVCLTLINIKNKMMEFYLSDETIQRSKFKFLKINDKINLELPLRFGQKISGHICQGHIDEVGKIQSIKKIDKSYLFDFEIVKKEQANLKLTRKDLGVSVACDGVCLTLIDIKNQIMEFYLSDETIQRSKFKFLKINDKINLELPLKFGQKISGHICQGHIDAVGKIQSIKKIDKSYLFDFEIVKKERTNLIDKASICINGISLTISKVTKKGFQVWVIPHTFKLTNLSSLKKNSLVNIEIDILSKYVRNYFNEKK